MDVLHVGKPVRFQSMTPAHVVSTIQMQFEKQGEPANLMVWTDPENADPNSKCRSVFVMRCDGMSEREIEVAKAPSYAEVADRFVFDPIVWNESFAPEQRLKRSDRPAKATKVGWENLAVGDVVTVRLYRRDLKFFLGRALLQRDLTDRQFMCERLSFLETGTVPVWKVTRVR